MSVYVETNLSHLEEFLCLTCLGDGLGGTDNIYNLLLGKNTSAPETNSINEAGEELDVPGRVTPDETLPLAEEDPQCYTLDEEAEGDDASR